MDKLRVGIIGCGGIANGKHLPALKALPGIEVVAFCDIIPERAEAAAKEYGTPDAVCYADYRQLLEDKSIVSAHVCTPNRSHSEITVAALEAGKHVLCEKPMAKTYAEAKLMLDAARRTGKVLSIGYQNRHTKESLYLKGLCDRGDLGEIYMAKAHAIRRRAVPTWGVFLNEYEQGGGPLIDIGTHALDLTLWMMDNYMPKTVTGTVYRKLADTENAANAWGPWDPKQFTVEDSAFGFITMENGATIFLESSWALNSLDVAEAKTSLCGTKAGADMREGLRINGEEFSTLYTKEVTRDRANVAFYDEKGERPGTREARLFYQAIKDGGKPLVLPEQAIVVTRILEAIYESAKLGRQIVF